MCVARRIKQIADREGISINELERSINASSGVLSRAAKNGTDIQAKWVTKVVDNYRDYSPEWILTGRGDMLREHLDNEKEQILVSAKNMQPLYYPKQQEQVHDTQNIPLYSYEAIGGLLQNIDNSTQYIQGTISIPNAPACDGAIRIVGDSMAPTIQSGDIIAFKHIHDIEHILYGHIFVVAYTFELDTYLVCKIIRKSGRGDDYITLYSLNKDYDPIDIPRSAIRQLAIIKLSINFHTIA